MAGQGGTVGATGKREQLQKEVLKQDVGRRTEFNPSSVHGGGGLNLKGSKREIAVYSI